ncbi:MAG: sporulation protein YabP [Firmicutes bacterium]|nr:sporulation protein YabP [Bacillota bacterium]
MAEDVRRGALKHRVSLDERENITVTGVTEVISFDEESIVCDTQMGVVVIHGSQMHITRLDLESGVIEAGGSIDSIEYTQMSMFDQKGGLLKRIFR